MEKLVVNKAGLADCWTEMKRIDQEAKKSVIIQDQTGNMITFMNMKGGIIDCHSFIVKYPSGNVDLKDFQETMRTTMVVGLRQGRITALSFDKSIATELTLSQLVEGSPFSDLNSLFNPSVLKDKEYYSTKFSVSQYTEDQWGNQGCFQCEEGFQLVILFQGSGEDYKTFMNHHNLNPNLFEVVIIN